MATDSSNPLAQYGYDQKTGQALADSLGLTTAQLAAAFATTPSTSVSQPQSGQGQYGKAGPGPTTGRDLSATVNQLQLMQAVGGGGKGQTSTSPTSNMVPVSQDPMNAATNLGAAALGMRAVYNPTPTQAGAKSGVGAVSSPTSSDVVPTVSAGPWNTTAGVFANQQQAQGMQSWAQRGGSGNPADAAAIEKAQGMAPGTIAQHFGSISGQPNYNPAPTSGGTPTPMTPFNAAGSATATPFATAPAAPTAAVNQDPAVVSAMHNNALEKAGQALFASFGGDPATATHADISNFHSQLTGMMGALTGGTAPAGAANYTAGVNQPPSALSGGPPPGPMQFAGAPKQMRSGGLVPGSGDRDNVLTLLTPGELVIPKDQVAQMFGRQPVKMAGGGFVTDDDEDQPPEVRRKPITTKKDAGSNTAPKPSPSSSSSPAASSTPAAGGFGGGLDWNAIAQARAARAPGPSATPYYSPGAGAYIGTSPGAGQSGYAYANPAAAVADPGATGKGAIGMSPNMGAAAGAIGGLASGLSAAAKTYADSFKSWQIQPNNIPSPPSAPSEPAATFSQAQAQRPPKQVLANPMMLATQSGYNPYQG